MYPHRFSIQKAARGRASVNVINLAGWFVARKVDRVVASDLFPWKAPSRPHRFNGRFEQGHEFPAELVGLLVVKDVNHCFSHARKRIGKIHLTPVRPFLWVSIQRILDRMRQHGRQIHDEDPRMEILLNRVNRLSREVLQFQATFHLLVVLFNPPTLVAEVLQ